MEKPFVWYKKDVQKTGANNVDYAWVQKVSDKKDQIKDEVAHYSLKGDLVDQVCDPHGLEA